MKKFIHSPLEKPALKGGNKNGSVSTYHRPWPLGRGSRRLIFTLFIVICGLLQVTVADYFKIFNIKPDLLLTSAVIAGLFFEPVWAISFSILSGLIKDIFSVSVFGMHALFFSIWCFLIITISRKISLDDDYIKLAILFILVILNNITIRLVLLFAGNFVSWGIFLRIAFVEALYTALIFPLVLKSMRHLSLISE